MKHRNESSTEVTDMVVGVFGSDSDWELLSWLSRGLLAVSDLYHSNEMIPYPLPDPLPRVFHHLAVRQMWKKKHFPTTLLELWAWAHQPLVKLGLELPPGVDPAKPLLENGLPTAQCEDLAELAGKETSPAAQYSSKLMNEVMDLCQTLNAPHTYVAFRQLLITSPVLTAAELERCLCDNGLGSLAQQVKKAYLMAPHFAARQGYLETCPRCNNLLMPTSTQQWVCVDAFCRHRQTGYQKAAKRFPVEKNVLWLHPGLRRYVAVPGQTEVRLWKRLCRMQIEVELWPDFDAYDLRLVFQDGEVWAVDVKDWGNPVALAREINNQRGMRQFPHWNRAFWVFPDHRRMQRPDYMELFKNNCEYLSATVSAVFEKEFLNLADKKLRQVSRSPHRPVPAT